MEKICYIIAAGEIDKLDFQAASDDLVICADGGLSAAEKAGIQPDLIVGDFDSLGVVPTGSNVVVHPCEKDETDSFLAIECGINRGYKTFVMYGMLGGRIDHSIANIQLLSRLSQSGMNGVLIGKNTIIETLTNSEKTFEENEKGIISIFSLTDFSEGVTLEGLKYELNNARLTSDFPLGISNEFIGKKSRVSVKNGTLLLIRI